MALCGLLTGNGVNPQLRRDVSNSPVSQTVGFRPGIKPGIPGMAAGALSARPCGKPGGRNPSIALHVPWTRPGKSKQNAAGKRRGKAFQPFLL